MVPSLRHTSIRSAKNIERCALCLRFPRRNSLCNFSKCKAYTETSHSNKMQHKKSGHSTRNTSCCNHSSHHGLLLRSKFVNIIHLISHPCPNGVRLGALSELGWSGTSRDMLYTCFTHHLAPLYNCSRRSAVKYHQVDKKRVVLLEAQKARKMAQVMIGHCRRHRESLGVSALARTQQPK